MVGEGEYGVKQTVFGCISLFIFAFRMEAVTAGVSADGSDSSSEGKFDGRGHIFWRAVVG